MDGPIMIFPIERTSRFQAQAYGEPMEYFRLDEPVFRHESEGFVQILKSSVKICVANSPRDLERKTMRGIRPYSNFGMAASVLFIRCFPPQCLQISGSKL